MYLNIIHSCSHLPDKTPQPSNQFVFTHNLYYSCRKDANYYLLYGTKWHLNLERILWLTCWGEVIPLRRALGMECLTFAHQKRSRLLYMSSTNTKRSAHVQLFLQSPKIMNEMSKKMVYLANIIIKCHKRYPSLISQKSLSLHCIRKMSSKSEN